jgi:RAB6A-GEF complex partner protein 2
MQHGSQKAPAATAPATTGGPTSGRLDPLSRVSRSMSGLSIASSARSSGDFHSLSNHSQETLASDQASLMSERPRFPSVRIRQHYKLDIPASSKPEITVLLMGYAQVSATFTLDGSLVDQSPFETVKRKGFLGGQAGGGVVGVKTPETTGKFFGGFTLNSIGESLGGLLNGGDLSSLKEMRHLTSSRAIPLLSTPQSLLFVDLQLEPGEEKSFSFKYKLPQGLPSSHRGKAIKVVYNLVIGVQGAPGDKDMQAVRQVNVPFRVFSGVNRDGEIFGHDLMQPYVILRDLAETAVIDGILQDKAQITAPAGTTAESSPQDFLAFVDTLIEKNRRRQSSSGTLDAASKSSDLQQAKHAINRAILFSNQVSTDVDRAPNRFEIAQDAKHVAVIILNRASHRLGETIAATVDFSDAQLQCFSIHASLETTEKVNPALALRSGTSISRVTRKVYASHSENALFAKRVVFSPFIPVSATPTLLTSGVNLNWTLRFEFATVTQTSNHDSEHAEAPSLLEEIVRDDRGVIQAAAEYAECDTFEVTIPLTVYGDVVTDGLDREEIVGLPI